MPEGRCAKCGSSDVIVAVDVKGGHGDGGNLWVALEKKPEAWLFKGEVRSSLKAWVCGACGFAFADGHGETVLQDFFNKVRVTPYNY